MKLLKIQYTKFSYKPLEPLFGAQQLADEKAKQFTDVTVLYVTIERNDDQTDLAVLSRIEVADHHVIVYPYAHLSRNLAPIGVVHKVIARIKSTLQQTRLVTCAPIGWSKAILSETRRDGKEQFYDSYQHEERIAVKGSSSIFLTTLTGNVLSDSELQQYPGAKAVLSENGGTAPESSGEYAFLQGAYSGQPALRTRLARLHNALCRYSQQLFDRHGYQPVKTPIIWHTRQSAVRDYFKHFPNKQFEIKDEGLVFRIATCLGMMKLFKSGYHHCNELPLGYYEIGTQYRKQQRGELKGLSRLVAFTMTDLHVFCEPCDSFNQFRRCLMMIIEAYMALGITNEIVVSLRYVQQFKYKLSMIYSLLTSAHSFIKPFILHQQIVDRTYYWFLKTQFSYVSTAGVCQLGTIQIDDVNGGVQGLTYTDTAGNKAHPAIIHCSPLGSIERILHYYLDYNPPASLYSTKVIVIPLIDNVGCNQACEALAAYPRVQIMAGVREKQVSLQKCLQKARAEDAYGYMIIGSKELMAGQYTISDLRTGTPLLVGNLAAVKTFLTN